MCRVELYVYSYDCVELYPVETTACPFAYAPARVNACVCVHTHPSQATHATHDARHVRNKVTHACHACVA